MNPPQVSVFIPVSYSFDFHNFVIWFEIRNYDASSFVLLSVAIQGLYGLSEIKFKTQF